MPTLNPRRAPKKETRASRAVQRLAEVIRHGGGVVVHLSGSHGHGTVGPYHPAVGDAKFALFLDNSFRGAGGRYEYTRALEAAEHAVIKFGVANVIAGMKRAAKKHGGEYTNLDTAVFKRNPRRRRARLPNPRMPTQAQLLDAVNKIEHAQARDVAPPVTAVRRLAKVGIHLDQRPYFIRGEIDIQAIIADLGIARKYAAKYWGLDNPRSNPRSNPRKRRRNPRTAALKWRKLPPSIHRSRDIDGTWKAPSKKWGGEYTIMTHRDGAYGPKVYTVVWENSDYSYYAKLGESGLLATAKKTAAAYEARTR
jgi:hypothetical protein